MSDAFAEQVASSPPTPPPAEGRSVSLIITLHPNRQIDFLFPPQGELLAYGLLEKARAKLDELALIREAQRQAKAYHDSAGLNGLLKKMKGR